VDREDGARFVGQVLAVLWRTRPGPARGPRPGLGVDQIIATAIEVADREGLAAVSMRRIADAISGDSGGYGVVIAAALTSRMDPDRCTW